MFYLRPILAELRSAQQNTICPCILLSVSCLPCSAHADVANELTKHTVCPIDTWHVSQCVLRDTW